MAKQKGVPDVLPKTTGGVGTEAPPLAKDNNARVSSVPVDRPRATAFARGAMAQSEAIGARLSISPSMKMPGVAEAQATQANGRIVRGRGRSNGFFSQGWAS